MMYCDTNILIRLMTNDVPHLRKKAQEVLETAAAGEICIPDVVLSELFFVLHYNPLYRLERLDICQRLSPILLLPACRYSDEAVQALKLAAASPKLDFTDCLLYAYSSGKKEKLFTFDKDLLKALG